MLPTPGTLRDYFAAHAPPVPAWWVNNPNRPDDAHAAVSWAWHYADEMLAERERSKARRRC